MHEKLPDSFSIKSSLPPWLNLHREAKQILTIYLFTQFRQCITKTSASWDVTWGLFYGPRWFEQSKSWVGCRWTRREPYFEYERFQVTDAHRATQVCLPSSLMLQIFTEAYLILLWHAIFTLSRYLQRNMLKAEQHSDPPVDVLSTMQVWKCTHWLQNTASAQHFDETRLCHALNCIWCMSIFHFSPDTFCLLTECCCIFSGNQNHDDRVIWETTWRTKWELKTTAKKACAKKQGVP